MASPGRKALLCTITFHASWNALHSSGVGGVQSSSAIVPTVSLYCIVIRLVPYLAWFSPPTASQCRTLFPSFFLVLASFASGSSICMLDTSHLRQYSGDCRRDIRHKQCRSNSFIDYLLIYAQEVIRLPGAMYQWRPATWSASVIYQGLHRRPVVAGRIASLQWACDQGARNP